MKFHVIGAGAIGGLTGAFLAKHGERVQFVDVVPEHVDQMNRSGLVIDGIAGEFRVNAPACLPQHIGATIDVALLAVKSANTVEALDGIHRFLGPSSLVVSLQNGLNLDAIAARVGTNRTIGAFINFSADYIAPGHIRYGGDGDYYLGRLEGASDERLHEMADKFRLIMNTVVTDNILGYLWSKQCYGSMLVGTALVDAPIHEVVAVRENQEVFTAAILEAVGVADKLGITLETFDVFDPATFRTPLDEASLNSFYDHVANRFKGSAKEHTGIWRDIKVRKRPTEVPWLTGEVLRQAERIGEHLPVNAAIVAMITELERGQRPQQWENLRELHRQLIAQG